MNKLLRVISSSLAQLLVLVLIVVLVGACKKDESEPPTRQPYRVQVRGKNTGKALYGARVIIELGGDFIPIDAYTDSDGCVIFSIDDSRVGDRGRLIVQADGYQAYIKDINLTKGTQSHTVMLEPMSLKLRASCPFYVYADWGSALNHYTAEGFLGDVSDIAFDDNYRLDSERPSVIQITYTPRGPDQWAGVYWWDPPGSNWANVDGGFDLSCATKLTFWARGEEGGEKAEFKVGGLKGTYQDSLQPALSTDPIILTSEWKKYSLDLAGKSLNHIIGGFAWMTNKPSNPNGATIYIDDIRFEK